MYSDDSERAYLDSGAVVPAQGGWKCLECGRTAPSVLSIDHANGCLVHRLVDAVPALRSGNAAALPPADLLQRVRAQVPAAVAADAAQLVEWLREAGASAAERGAVADLMLERFPGLPARVLEPFRRREYAGEAPYALLSAMLMHSAACAEHRRQAAEGAGLARAGLSASLPGPDALTRLFNRGQPYA